MGHVITIEAMRDYIRDRTPDDNLLLGDLEFSDPDYMSAFYAAAAAFNDLPPHVVDVSGSSLPASEWAFMAVQEALYRVKLAQLERNAFVYKAGNTSYDEDQEQIRLLNGALSRLAVWRQNASAHKRRINLSASYASFE